MPKQSSEKSQEPGSADDLETNDFDNLQKGEKENESQLRLRLLPK